MMTSSERSRSLEFEATDRLAIVAGSGRLPIDVAESLAARGKRPFIVLVRGEASPDLACYDHQEMDVEDFPSLGKVLKAHGATHAVFAGGISRRPVLSRLKPNMAFFRLLPRAVVALTKGDDGILRALAGVVESQGIKVVGAHEVAPDVLAPEGKMTAVAPRRSDWRDLEAAAEAARAIGALDIGQAAIAIGGRAIALEGIEGTDGLLERVRDLRLNGRVAGRTRGVLVKYSKPGQELRLDLPTIGPATVTAAHAAGLAGIGVEAGHSIVLDAFSVVEEADKLGLFVIGLPPWRRS